MQKVAQGHAKDAWVSPTTAAFGRCTFWLDLVVVYFFNYIFNKFEVVLEHQDSKKWMYIRVNLMLRASK